MNERYSPATEEALKFYQGEAEALARYLAEGKENKSDAILASVTVLALDGGRRAATALRASQPATPTGGEEDLLRCGACGTVNSFEPRWSADIKPVAWRWPTHGGKWGYHDGAKAPTYTDLAEPLYLGAAQASRQFDPANYPNMQAMLAAHEEEIDRLRAIVRVNGLRWGHTHAEIDEILALTSPHSEGGR